MFDLALVVPEMTGSADDRVGPALEHRPQVDAEAGRADGRPLRGADREGVHTGNTRNGRAALQARAIKARLSPLVDIIVTAGTCLVLWYGARLVLSGALTSGALVVFMLYLRKLYSPLKDLAKMTNTFSRAAVGMEAIQEVMREEEQIPNRPDAIAAGKLTGNIEFDHVQFGYTPERLALKADQTGADRSFCWAHWCRKDNRHQSNSSLL